MILRHHNARAFAAAIVVLPSLLLLPGSVSAAGASTTLFKVITVKDDIVIGFGAADDAAVGVNPNVESVAAALDSRHYLGAWLYGSRRGGDGQIVLAPLHRIALLNGTTLRIENYTSDQPVTAPEK